MRLPRGRGPFAAALAILTALPALAVAAPSTPASAVTPRSAINAPLAKAVTGRHVVTPGNFTGYGFDQCLAPTQAAMDAWLTSSPFWAVGIYISGDSRGCLSQPNLTPRWVSTQLANGWRLLPITLGPQASCTTRQKYRSQVRINPDSTRRYAAARHQGAAEADKTVGVAARLGIAEGSTLWYDLEAFDISGTGCRESALSFLSSWTKRLHRLGYVSGAYSSAASGIKALDDAAAERPGVYAMPDHIWIADWNGRADVWSAYVRTTSWMPHKRIHQYLGGHNETHGGVTINIDRNWLDVGRGSVAPAPRPSCGVAINFPDYPALDVGANAAQVPAVKCLLTKKHFYSGGLGPRYTRAAHRALNDFQADQGLPLSASLTSRAWTQVLADGTRSVLKRGSASIAVRRVQRSLNAATGAGVRVTGVFGRSTTKAVLRYQRQHGLTPTGVVANGTWNRLQVGHPRVARH